MPRDRSLKPEGGTYLDALRLLARRELSEAQVRQRLARRQHTTEDIDAAIGKLKEEELLDDQRVAEAIARSETSIRRRGKLRIKQQLARAGIAPATARRAIDVVFSDIDDDALLEAALFKRLRHGRLIADEREFRRLYQYLISQGFEPDRALKILSAKRSSRS